MNYTYDIYLNLCAKLYDFFEWNKNDKVIHIKKTPIFKINEEILNKFINYTIKVEQDFLKYVHNKTELWNVTDYVPFCALFCDNNNIVAIEFNEFGISVKKSFLLIDEELEILETIKKIPHKNIVFEVIKKENVILETRNELYKERFINNELYNIELSKLSYIYLECFGRQEKSKRKIITKLKNLPKNSIEYKKLYNILKLTSTSKNKMI